MYDPYKKEDRDFAARLGHPIMTDEGVEIDGVWFTRFQNKVGYVRGRRLSGAPLSSIYVGWCNGKLCAKRKDSRGRFMPVRMSVRKRRRRG